MSGYSGEYIKKKKKKKTLKKFLIPNKIVWTGQGETFQI